MQKLFSTLALGLLASTFSYANQNTLEKNLKANYPEIPMQVIGETPIKKIYTVQVGDGLVYTDENARYFFVGNLVDFKNKENLTEKQEQKLRQIDTSALPLENALKMVKGNGERVIYVFSDPDCPYCKRLEQALTGIDNVTIYTFMYPLTNIHPQAEQVAQQIWCSKNAYEAWEDYMIHQQPPSASPDCKNPIQQNIELGRSLNIAGTPTFFLGNGERIAGGRDTDEIEALLNTVK